eukprot:8494405-Alexandrium_andersonii.AAC.1
MWPAAFGQLRAAWISARSFLLAASACVSWASAGRFRAMSGICPQQSACSLWAHLSGFSASSVRSGS